MSTSCCDAYSDLILSGLFSFSLFLKTILNGDENTLVFQNLNPNTLYEVSVTAIYPDESESDDLIGSERTRRCLIFSRTFFFLINRIELWLN